jgi:SAM-dependent methyltransferase
VTVLYPARARGTPIVRYYWHRFLEKHRDDIRGSVLEIGTTATVRAYGGSQIQQTKVIDIVPSSSDVTIVADLATADHLEPDQFDCFVNQFTMHIIDDFKAALYHSIRLLKPAGVLLINFPARSGYPSEGLDLNGAGRAWVYRWFTPAGVEKALADLGMTEEDYQLTTYGNFFSLTAYMAGIGAEELTSHELDYEEKDIPLLICARVVKPFHWPAQSGQPA